MVLSAKAYDYILTAILKGEIAPGEKLNEAKLAQKLSISRIPIREAMNKLAKDRLLEYLPHSGAKVIEFSFHQLIELYQIRETLEGLAASCACQKMTNQELLGLEKMVYEQQNKLDQQGDSYFLHKADFDFHNYLINKSGNTSLIQILNKDLYPILRFYRFHFSYSQRVKTAFSEHLEIVKALQKRDKNLAEEVMRSHIRNATQEIQKFFDKGG